MINMKSILTELKPVNKNPLKITVVKKYGEGKTLETLTFDPNDRKGAKKARRELMKKYDLINHGGYYVNYKTTDQLITNF